MGFANIYTTIDEKNHLCGTRQGEEGGSNRVK